MRSLIQSITVTGHRPDVCENSLSVIRSFYAQQTNLKRWIFRCF